MNFQPKDLRYFLAILDEKWPGEVLRVDTAGKEFSLGRGRRFSHVLSIVHGEVPAERGQNRRREF